MSRGKGLVQFIVHMSHLTPVGWGYFGCSILLSGAFYSSSKMVLPLSNKGTGKEKLSGIEMNHNTTI